MTAQPFARDRTPLQAGLRMGGLANKFPMYSLFGVMEAVVLRAIQQDDPRSNSKKWTEYDVIEVSTRQVFLKAKLSRLFAGLENFEDVDLAETTGTVDGAPLVLEASVAGLARGPVAAIPNPADRSRVAARITPTVSTNLNGERVAIVCPGGIYDNAIIIGALPHPEATFSSKTFERPRFRKRYNKWQIDIDKAANLSARQDDGREIVMLTDGTVRIKNKNGQKFEVTDTGTVNVEQAAGQDVNVGLGATFTVNRAELLNAQLASIVAALSTSTIANAAALSDPFAIPAATAAALVVTAAAGEFAAALSTFPSPNVKVP